MNAPGGTGVSVIGGYLGSGKTTLVNHLLGQARDMRLAVLVNDFGSIAIDAGLIVSHSASVISLSGGCVCCSYGSDLIGALQSLVDSPEPPQSILIETSGVALPRVVLQSASLVPGLRACGVTVVADAETLLARAADRFVADTVTRQVREADLVLLNKVDLVPVAHAPRPEAWIRSINPGAAIVRTEHSKISLATVLHGVRGHADRRRQSPAAFPPEATFGSQAMRTHPTASMQFRSEEFVPDGAVDVEWLARELARPERRLLRAKGLLTGPDGSLQVLQVVDQRFEVGDAGDTAQPRATGLVCIGRSGDIDRGELAALIETAAIRSQGP